MMPTGEATQARQPGKETRALAAGGLVAGLLASSCCLLPLLLLSAGISGAWIAQLTALAPYQPLFFGVAVISLGFGFWRAYRRQDCAAGTACERPGVRRATAVLLWLGVAAVLAAVSVDTIAPFILQSPR
jgi:mercuric ion transport protein